MLMTFEIKPIECNQIYKSNILLLFLYELANDYYRENNIESTHIKIYMNYVMTKKVYDDFNSLLHNLIFTENDNLIIISAKNINNNLIHTNEKINKILHETKYLIFDKSTFEPICYAEKAISENENIDELPNNNSYLKKHVYDIMIDYHEKDFDQSRIIIKKHHIGNYIVLFHTNNKWLFTYSCNGNINIYEYNCVTHPILFEHIGDKINSFDTNYTYHIVLSDTRIRRLITPSNERNYVVLIKIVCKNTLQEYIYENIPECIKECMIIDERIYFSCYDELIFNLEELDEQNIYKKRLINIGYICKVNNINILYNVNSYKKILAMIPKNMSINEIHLYLYQIDKLNHLLQYVSDSYNDIVKRINLSMSTLSKEILDIYHMTRNMKNSDLYNILSNTYKQILYQLHSEYILIKNDDDENRDEFDEKISITVDNVYVKLKTIDTSLLIELYKDRVMLSKDVININNSIIKNCIYTKIQTKLLL